MAIMRVAEPALGSDDEHSYILTFSRASTTDGCDKLRRFLAKGAILLLGRGRASSRDNPSLSNKSVSSSFFIAIFVLTGEFSSCGGLNSNYGPLFAKCILSCLKIGAIVNSNTARETSRKRPSAGGHSCELLTTYSMACINPLLPFAENVPALRNDVKISGEHSHTRHGCCQADRCIFEEIYHHWCCQSANYLQQQCLDSS